eukprot:TRINITY_DN14242_c0_g1_i1.p3 TRINITY_DN14242_c0_g1~~TRINITY_DN14242_c0_g1_i1.p3  ORF type:complete len:168 (+),score=24.62 TRINITY_DN14242_c0_g1_i1:340-843(+)
MQYIHVLCLQKLLKKKVKKKTSTNIATIMWKNLECDICKTQFPQEITVNNITYSCIKMPKPSSTYIIFDILSQENNQIKGFYIINMSCKHSFMIGRGHETDVRITDITVSRQHAILNYSNEKFYIKDNNSKFGTLILLQEPFAINSINNNIIIQINRTIFEFTIKKT